jgi:hypothetical protein
MKRVTIAGVFVAVLALSGLTAGSASAGWICLATFFGGYDRDGAIGEQCQQPLIIVYTGWDLFQTTGAKEIAKGVLCALVEAGEPSLYSGSNCAPSEEKKGEGAFAKAFVNPHPAFSPSTKQRFSSTSGSSKLVGDSGAETVTCSSDVSTGEITSTMEVGSVVMHFLGCTSSGTGGSNCTVKSTNTTNAGLILTTTLHGVLGFTAVGSGAGLLLLPHSGKVLIELAGNTCTKETKVTGDVTAEESPVGTSSTTGKLVFATSSGKQVIPGIVTLSGLVESELTAFSTTASEQTEESVTYEKSIEIT